MNRFLSTFVIMLLAVAPAAAQDVRGLEVCTAEKSMERRTSCLQSNVEFLQQSLDKQTRDIRTKLIAASREAAAQKAEIAAMKSELTKLQRELIELKKPKPTKK
jgi:septal ring factor EnvC (AmiA/AmiB activator)